VELCFPAGQAAAARRQCQQSAGSPGISVTNIVSYVSTNSHRYSYAETRRSRGISGAPGAYAGTGAPAKATRGYAFIRSDFRYSRRSCNQLDREKGQTE